MGIFARKLMQYSGKIIKDNPDMGNPLSADSVDLMVHIGKGVLKLGKELLL